MTLYRNPRESDSPKQDKIILEERLGPVFNYAPDACYLTDATGKLVDVNNAAGKNGE